MQEVIDSHAEQGVRNEIEMIGLSETQNENLHHAVLTLVNKIGVSLNNDDIDEIYRAGARRADTEDKPRPIVIRLVRHAKRKELIKATKQRKSLSTEAVVPGPVKPVFINERLTQKNRLLFRESRFSLLLDKRRSHLY